MINKQKSLRAYESLNKVNINNNNKKINSARYQNQKPLYNNIIKPQRKSIRTAQQNSNKKKIQDRLQNIRKGFNDLQKNWNLTDNYKDKDKGKDKDKDKGKDKNKDKEKDRDHNKNKNIQLLEQSKLSFQKQITKTHKKQASSSSNIQIDSLKNQKKKDIKCDNHNCIYYKSLYNLIRIIEVQKQQIQSLKSQLSQAKFNQTLSSKKSSSKIKIKSKIGTII